MTNPARPLSEQQVREILLDTTTSHTRMAEQMGVTREAVRRIRYGMTYCSIAPEVPRWPQERQRKRRDPVLDRTCKTCAHVDFYYAPTGTGKSTHKRYCCSLDLPDIKEEGPRFARWCAAYAPSKAASLASSRAIFSA